MAFLRRKFSSNSQNISTTKSKRAIHSVLSVWQALGHAPGAEKDSKKECSLNIRSAYMLGEWTRACPRIRKVNQINGKDHVYILCRKKSGYCGS